MTRAKHLHPISHRLIDGLQRILSTGLDLPLIPLNDNKQPLGDGWQNRPFIADELIDAIQNGGVEIAIGGKNKKIQPQGFGLLTGKPLNRNGQTYYLMALDQDGESAGQKILELSSCIPLPETVAFSSGRQGRCQYLFLVPEEYKDAIRTVKVKTGIEGDDGKPEQLEFRFRNLQSVLPPSVHPSTGEYHWKGGCAIDECPIAIAPDWVIEQMLVTPHEKPSLSFPSTPTRNRWTEIDFARSYLESLSTSRADYYEDWIKVGMALKSVSDSLLWDWENWSRGSSKYQPGECDKKWRSFSADKGVTLGTLAHMAKEDGWRFPFSKSDASRDDAGKFNDEKSTVTGDTPKSGDARKPDRLSLADTVTRVTALLESGLKDYEERNELDSLQMRSQMSKTAFWEMVKARRCHLEEVQPSDRERLNQLIDWTHTRLDFQRILPPSLAAALIHDGKILNIDPIALLQYLLPAVLSLVGKRVNINIESHKVPAILWTCIVGESGCGKTRAETVVLDPLKERQKREYKRWMEEIEQYNEQLRVTTKDSSPPAKPQPQKKYLFEVATIQALLRRLAEQGSNGSLWARDELAGLFKSLGQFSKGDNEALECLLKTWDGHGALVERVDAEKDSYNVFETRLSIAGGIQPGAFRSAFKDPEDAQGLQARFLYAVLKPQPPKRVRGYCELKDILPPLYDRLSNCPEGQIELSRSADQLYSQIYEDLEQQALECSSPTVRAWLRKLPGQMLRIALALHLLEYYFSGSSTVGFYTISEETLSKAFEVCRYYKSSFELVQEKTGGGNSTPSILLKIWDAAAICPEGVTPRDVYRSVKAIGRRAAELGRNAAAYTVELFSQLAAMGRGTVERVGRIVRFKAHLNPSAPQNNEMVGALSEPASKTKNTPSSSQLSTLPAIDGTIDAPPVSSEDNLSTQEVSELAPNNFSVAPSSEERAVTEVTFPQSQRGSDTSPSPLQEVSPVTESVGPKEEIVAPSSFITKPPVEVPTSAGADRAMSSSIPPGHRETLAEVIQWLEISVREKGNFLPEIMEIIKELIAEAPEMKRWLWQSLTGEVKLSLANLSGDDYQYFVVDGG